MSTYTQILYQIVFSTKDREKTMIESGQEKLYSYIAGILKNKDCHLYRINGVEDHLHIATHIHPSIALANLVKDIKLASSDYIKEKNILNSYRSSLEPAYEQPRISYEVIKIASLCDA